MEVCRFIEVMFDMEDGKEVVCAVMARTERQISESIDMADCHGMRCLYYYVNDAGTFSAITLGELIRYAGEDYACYRYGYSPMIAEGKIVGYVQHTDH